MDSNHLLIMTPQDFKRLRKRVGSQKDVADAFGVSVSTIEKQENGKQPLRPVYVFALRQLAHDRAKREGS